ncbi:MAG: family 16 glycoside hydrolase [Chloroflexota bacterium]|nr:family 16 glycoside hydrolase [Chloroflexota bacterium]
MSAKRKWLIAVLVVLGIVLLGLAGLWTRFTGGRPPRPTPMPKADLPWSDDFSESGDWQAESDAAAQVEVQDGAMSVYIAAPNQLAWASNGREFSDFHLAIEAAQVAGPDNNEYGVLARMEDTDHFYRFSISGDGYYMVSKYDGEVWESLSGDWALSDAIQTGAATNLLEVVCQGATMTFFVNGVQLVQVEDADYSRGDIALYAGAFFEPEVEVHFDNLRVEEP